MTRRPAEHRRPAVLYNQRGAVTIVTLFAATLLIGMLFYVLGVGQAIRHRETLQDAADSAAFSSGVVHARGMNLVVLLNLVKLSVTTMSMSLLAAVAGAAAAATFAFRQPNLFWTIPLLWLVAQRGTIVWTERLPVFAQIYTAADRAQNVIADEVGAFAELRADDQALAFSGVRAAFKAPQESRLPVAAEPLPAYCARVRALSRGILDEAYGDVRGSPVYGEARDIALAAIGPMCVTHARTGRMLASGARPGGERFQLRLFVVGAQLRPNEELGTRVSTWMQNEGGGRVHELRAALSQVGLAQAEYYPGGASPRARSELMWHLDWKARLRRFRSPDGFAGFSDACARAGGEAPCGAIAAALDQATELLVH